MRSFLTVSENVYYQAEGSSPSQVALQFQRELKSEDTMCSRKQTVGLDWVPLDTGWLADIGHLVIVNDEAKFRQTIPTKEVRANAMLRVVELKSDGEPFTEVPPLESIRLNSTAKYFVRCRHETASIWVHVFPK